MKQKKILIAAAASLLFLSSCVISSQHFTTGNPVGTKVGYIKMKVKKDFPGVAGAAKEGKISKIATVDIKYYVTGKVSIKVTGE